MYTAEIIWRQQNAASMRLHRYQLRLIEEFKPIAKLWHDRVVELHPELKWNPNQSDSAEAE